MPPMLSLEDCARLVHKCKQEGSQTFALQLFACLLKTGLYVHPLVGGNHLLSLLVLLDCISSAQLLFNCLSCRDQNSWNILITGYARCGPAEKLVSLYKEIPDRHLSGICSSAIVALLKACTALRDMGTGSDIHSRIATLGMHESDSFIATSLIDMYAKCGALAKAEEVFRKLPFQTAVCWNALLTGYVEHCLGTEALKCFEKVQDEGGQPDAVTLIYAMKACAMIEAVSRGQELHMDTAKWGLDEELRIGSALVDMYAKFSLLADAQKAFDRITVRDVILWTSLVAGYADGGKSRDAINCYNQMSAEHIVPNAVTYACTLKACIDIKAMEQGQNIHMDVERRGHNDLLTGNALVDFYAKTNLLTEAITTFEKLATRQDQVLWNILIGGFIEQGHPHEATHYIGCMEKDGVSLDTVTFIMGLKSFASLVCPDSGKVLHSEVIKRGFEWDVFVSSALIDFYVKCGFWREAQDVFDELPSVDLVCWTALIAGYAEHGFFEKVLTCFKSMVWGGFLPRSGTLESCLKACGGLGALGIGYKLHTEILGKGWEQVASVSVGLIDSYANSGAMAEAQAVFDKAASRNMVLWCTLIAGYAQVGDVIKVMQVLEKMDMETVELNPVVTSSVLSVCSRAGAWDLGRGFFEKLITSGYYVFEDCVCMLDCLSRAGHFHSANVLITKMPFQPQRVSWRISLGAFQRYGNGICGRLLERYSLHVDELTPHQTYVH